MRSILDRPFTEGIITDRPAHTLGPRHSTFAQDGFSPQGVFRQRQGWEYSGAATGQSGLEGVYRVQFILADKSQTLITNTSSHVLESATTASTVTPGRGGDMLPRCVYRDELIICAQDGVGGIVRYAGSALGASAVANSGGTIQFVGNEGSIITAGTWASAPDPGSFIQVRRSGGDAIASISYKVVTTGDQTAVTIEDLLSSAGDTIGTGGSAYGWGNAYPAVSVYNAGTITVSSSTATGYGTLWDSLPTLSNEGYSMLIIPTTGNSEHGALLNSNFSADTSASVALSDQATKSQYAITTGCPFKDAASHKGSLWGTGVAPYPSRVYVGPPGWNLSYPPGFVLPFNPAPGTTSPNANDFLLDFIDVPSSYDGDDNVAILPSPNPLLVLKRKAVYGIYGSFPNFSVDMVADGIGCIDIRSAHSYDEGQFWAGEGGIYWYTGGRIVDLTAGRINREWRELTRDFDYGTSDFCTLGLAQGHLIVHITTGGGTTERTYLCDLRDGSWQSRISNFTPKYLFTSRIPGEAERLLAVSDDREGRVLDFAPALDGSGTAKDDAGSAPRLQAYTPEGISGAGIEDDTRMMDMAIHANVYDAGAAGSTSMTVSVVSSDALTDDASSKSLADIDSDTTDRTDRHYFRRVDRRGRRHQVRLAVDTLGTDSNATTVEVEQIAGTFRRARSRT